MRVARALHQPVHAVAAAPFAETAWTHLQLVELEALDEIERDAEELRAASRLAVAFHEPKGLQREQRALEARILSRDAAAPDDARARGLALAARLTRGQVLVS